MGTILQTYSICQYKVYKNKAVSKIKNRSRGDGAEVNKVSTRVSPRNSHQIMAGRGSPPVILDLGVND